MAHHPLNTPTLTRFGHDRHLMPFDILSVHHNCQNLDMCYNLISSGKKWFKNLQEALTAAFYPMLAEWQTDRHIAMTNAQLFELTNRVPTSGNNLSGTALQFAT